MNLFLGFNNVQICTLFKIWNKKLFTLLNFVKFDLNYKILVLTSSHALQVCDEALKSVMRLA